MTTQIFQPKENPDDLYESFDKNLYRIDTSDQGQDIMSQLSANPGADNSANVTVSASDLGSGVDTSMTVGATGSYSVGKKTFDNTASGFILGFDPKDGYSKFYIGNTTNYLNWTGTTLVVAGSISASSIDIPDTVTANSFHVDSSGNAWWGATSLGSAVGKVLNTGAATFSNITITGGSITTTPISGIPNNSSTDISLLEYTHDLVFSVTDADTIAWTSGTITLSNGRTFSISSGNTGNMSALTYIYLDPGASSTVLQTTTTYSTAIGANKKLIGTAQNNTVTASFIPYGPGRALVDGSNIGALSIVAGNIAANTITAGKLTVSQLSAIAADLGSITAGSISVVDSGNTVGIVPTGTYAFFSGPTGSPTFTVTPAGVLTATGATLTGGTVQTNTSGNDRIVMTGSSIRGYNSSNVNRLTFSNDTIEVNDTSGNPTITFRDGHVTIDSSDHLVETNCTVYALSGSTYDLGLSGNRWNTLYAVATNISSDARLKKNQKKDPRGLVDLVQLDPLEYDMYGKKRHGFLAQEVYKVIPEVTNDAYPGADEGKAGINYSDLIPIVVHALQEINDRLVKLEKKNGL